MLKAKRKNPNNCQHCSEKAWKQVTEKTEEKHPAKKATVILGGQEEKGAPGIIPGLVLQWQSHNCRDFLHFSRSCTWKCVELIKDLIAFLKKDLNIYFYFK